jgi:hypothetical protein
MPKNSLSAEKEYVIQTLSAYWKDNEDLISKLPLVKAPLPIEEKFPPELSNVSLPSWANDIGIDGDLLVPNWTIIQGEKPEWERTDWLSAMFWYIHGSAERAYESLNGPIHSNSFYLKNSDLVLLNAYLSLLSPQSIPRSVLLHASLE